MRVYLIVVNGYEGIEEILGLLEDKQQALSRRESIIAQCISENAKREEIEAIKDEAERYAQLEKFDGKFAYISPEQICVREIVDDGAALKATCVSNCASYRFTG